MSKRPDVILVQDINPKLVANLRSNGLWMCHCLVPKCSQPPFAEVARDQIGPSGKPIRSLFCKEHAKYFAAKIGAVIPNSTSPTPPSTPTAGATEGSPSGTPPTDRRE